MAIDKSFRFVTFRDEFSVGVSLISVFELKNCSERNRTSVDEDGLLSPPKRLNFGRTRVSKWSGRKCSYCREEIRDSFDGNDGGRATIKRSPWFWNLNESIGTMKTLISSSTRSYPMKTFGSTKRPSDGDSNFVGLLFSLKRRFDRRNVLGFILLQFTHRFRLANQLVAFLSEVCCSQQLRKNAVRTMCCCCEEEDEPLNEFLFLRRLELFSSFFGTTKTTLRPSRWSTKRLLSINWKTLRTSLRLNVGVQLRSNYRSVSSWLIESRSSKKVPLRRFPPSLSFFALICIIRKDWSQSVITDQLCKSTHLSEADGH